MDAWGRAAGAEGIDMLADGNGDFVKALGLELDATAFAMGHRGQRFALVAEDGVVTGLFVEGPGEFKVSAAEHMLSQL
jgi:peroxiredoxin